MYNHLLIEHNEDINPADIIWPSFVKFVKSFPAFSTNCSKLQFLISFKKNDDIDKDVDDKKDDDPIVKFFRGFGRELPNASCFISLPGLLKNCFNKNLVQAGLKRKANDANEKFSVMKAKEVDKLHVVVSGDLEEVNLLSISTLLISIVTLFMRKTRCVYSEFSVKSQVLILN